MTKCTSKQIKNAYKQFLKSCNYSLYDCYGNFSRAKENAFKYCLNLVNKYNGIHYKIIGFNSMQFSFGFVGEIDGQKAFFYITKDYDRFIPLNLLEV